jgi:RecA-family ATPase
LPTGGWLMIHGAPKSGKSFAIMDLAVAVAAGDPSWLTFPLHTAGPVIYLQLDTPRGEWQRRISALRDEGRDTTLLHTCDRADVPGFNLFDPNHQAWLRARVQSIQPVMVVVDTLRRSYQGPENDSEIATLLMKHLETACANTAIVLVHHSRKGNPNPKIAKDDRDNVMDNIRGTSAFTGQMDTVMYLTGSRLLYEGRSIEDGKLNVERLPNLLWAVKGSDIDAHIREIVATTPGVSIRGRAKLLAERIPDLGEEAAKGRLDRWLQKHRVVDPTPVCGGLKLVSHAGELSRTRMTPLNPDESTH